MIVFHHNDADGRCAAAIVLKWHEEKLKSEAINFVEMDYRAAPKVGVIMPGETVVIVDFSFKPEVMKAVFDRTEHVIWCDHHVTAKDYDYGEKCQGIRDFNGSEGRSGCELAWEYFFPMKKMPEAVRLLGEYDAGRCKNKQCFPFYEGLKMEATEPTTDFWAILFDDLSGGVRNVIMCGEVAMKYRDQHCQWANKQFGYMTRLDSHLAWACNVSGFGRRGLLPQTKTSLDAPVELVIGYVHDGESFSVSLYSTGLDVGEIAKKYGGGGHKEASGFICKKLPFLPL